MPPLLRSTLPRLVTGVLAAVPAAMLATFLVPLSSPAVAAPDPVAAPAVGPFPGTALAGRCGAELCVAYPGQRPRALTSDGASRPRVAVAVAGDGSRAAFVAGGAAYYGDPARGSYDQLVAAPGVSDVRLSATGVNFIASVDRATEGPSLLSGGKWGPRVYSVPDSSYRASISRQDQLVVAHRGGVCLVPAGPGPALPSCSTPPGLNPDPGTTLGVPTASPNGALIVVAATGGAGSSVLLYDAGSGALVRRLTTGPDDADPTFSPDGRFVAFARGGSSWSVPVGGGEPALLVAGLVGPTWVPTGSPLAPADPRMVGRKMTLFAPSIRLTYTCEVQSCGERSWVLRVRGKAFSRFTLPKIPRGERVTNVRVSKAKVRKIVEAGPKGLKAVLVAPGLADRKVRIIASSQR